MSEIVESVKDIEKYSTTEQAIGTWIDGKTLYRRCYKHNATISSGSTFAQTALVDLSSWNISEIISMTGSVDYGTGFYENIPYCAIVGSDAWMYSFVYNRGTKWIYLQHTSGASVDLSNIRVVLIYTK